MIKKLLIGLLLSTTLYSQDFIVNFFKYSTAYAGFNLTSPVSNPPTIRNLSS